MKTKLYIFFTIPFLMLISSCILPMDENAFRQEKIKDTKYIATESVFVNEALPKNRTVLFDNPTILDWSEIKGASNYKIEIAPDRNFNSILLTRETIESSLAISAQFNAGKTYYWRVTPFVNGYWADPSKNIVFTIAGDLVSDSFTDVTDGYSNLNGFEYGGNTSIKQNLSKGYISIESDDSDNIVRLTLKGLCPLYKGYNALKYKSSDSDKYDVFVNGIKQEKHSIYADFQYYELINLVYGQNCIEWKSKDYGNNSYYDNYDYWDLSEFSLYEVPNPNSFINTALPKNRTVLFDSPTILDWSDIKGASKYKIDIASDRDFQTILINRECTESFTNINQYFSQKKTYYWRVTPFIEGFWADSSKSIAFTMAGELVSDSFTDVTDGYSNLNGFEYGGNTFFKQYSSDRFIEVESDNSDNLVRLTLKGFCTGYKILKFKSSDPYDYDVYVNDIKQQRNITYSDGLYSELINLVDGQNCIEWKSISNDSYHYWRLRDFSIFEVPNPNAFKNDNFETGDFSINPYTFSGTIPVTIDNTLGYQESKCAMFKPLVSGSSTGSMFLVVNTTSPKILKFQLKLSSSAPDFYLYIDSVVKLSNYPTVWQQCSIPIPIGVHTIEWRFVQNSLFTAWLDNITFE